MGHLGFTGFLSCLLPVGSLGFPSPRYGAVGVGCRGGMGVGVKYRGLWVLVMVI